MKTISKSLLFTLIILLGMSACNNFTNKIITSNHVEESQVSYGYELSKPFYYGGFSLKIWSSRGMNFSFYDSKLSVNNIIEERWLGNNRAIYLHLDLIAQKDSYAEQRTAKILFDYRRGELYATSVEPLWRTGQRAGYDAGDNLWLSEKNFQNILAELEK